MAKIAAKYSQPDQAAPDAIKETKDYGASVANFIANEWFFNNSGVARFYDTREEFERLRLYARGNQSTAKYKRELAVDGDLSFLNLDWEPVMVIPKFVDLIVNKHQHRAFDIVAKAMDSASLTKKNEDIQTLRGEMERKQELLSLQQQTGVEMFKNNPDTLPETEEELEVWSSLNYKQNLEIAAESAVNHVLNSNNWDAVKKRIDRDITEIGIGCAKHAFCPQKGVKVEYVDPSNFIYSYTEDPDFSDAYYYGEIKRITVADLLQMFPNLTQEELKLARQAGAAHYDYNGITYDQVQSEDDEAREANKVEVMFFAWKTVRKNVYKIRENRKGGKTAKKKDENLSDPKTSDAKFEKIEQQEEVIYEGVQILGNDDLLLKWELQKNMTRPKSSTMEVLLPYVVSAPNYYKGRYDSIVKRIVKYADLYHLAHIKIQQVIQKAVPSGIYIDADGLMEIDMGDGNSYNPREALNMYLQTGSIVGRSMTQLGDRNAGAIPIQELAGSPMIQLEKFIGAQQYYLEQMRIMTGINEAADASSPDPRALVGVQKQQAANSDVATRHILEAVLSITRRIADASINRMQDVFEFHPLKENFINAVGKVNAAVLESLGDLHLGDFAVEIELEPDDEEKQYLEQNIQQALQQGLIHLDDAIDVRSIKSIKFANQLIKVRRKKKAKEDAEQQEAIVQQQAEAQQNAAIAIEEAKTQASATLTENQLRIEQTKADLKIKELEAEMNFEKDILMLKHSLAMQALGVEQSHDSNQQDKNNKSSMKQAQVKDGGTGDFGINSKANTVDGTLKGKGLLGGN